MYVCLSVCLSVCWSSLHGPISYSLLGGGTPIPEQQICGTLDSVTLFSLLSPRQTMVLPSIDLHIASIVSMYQSPQRIFLVNTLYVIYIILNGRTEICRNFCIVFFIVLEAVEILIPQRSLRYWAVTSECLSEIWHVCVIGIYDFPESILGFPNSSLFSEEIFCISGQW